MADTTIMAEAFERAGFKPMAEKLREMMIAAIEAGDGPGIFDSAFDHFVGALAKAHDADLLWELFADFHRKAIGTLYAKVRFEHKGRAGHGRNSPQGATIAVPAATPEPGPRDGSPQGAKKTIPVSGEPANLVEPVRVSYRGLGRALTAARLATFMLRDTGRREKRFADFRFSELPSLAAHHGKSAWIATTDYNLIIQTMEWQRTQAFVSPDAKIGDVLDEAQFEKLIAGSITRTGSPLFLQPNDLEKIAEHT